MAQGLFSSSIGRKYAMALSAFFLIIFLIVHLLVNMLSVISEDGFNQASHFMGTNPLVQFLFQPILIAGVIFHFVWGFILELKNKKARGKVKYVKNHASQNSTWMSRNMIYSGLVILLFLGLHFKDFWFPEMTYKYVEANPESTTRYFGELVHKFADPTRVSLYVLAFIFLSLHLMHGFKSAFQSVGANHRKYNGFIKGLGTFYAIAVPLGFIFIAVYHFLNH